MKIEGFGHKKLYLRITTELDHLVGDEYYKACSDIRSIFSKYFKSLEFLFLKEQKLVIDNLRKKMPVVSMDKWIQGDINVDISRLFDTNGKFIKHTSNFYSLDTDFFDNNDTVILYDHDVVGGYQVRSIAENITYFGSTVLHFNFVKVNNADTEEVLDLCDFLLDINKFYEFEEFKSSAGLLILNDDNKMGRISYLNDIVDFEKQTSIPSIYKDTLYNDILNLKTTYGIT